ncbi:MAG: GntR family transcriptional regulator [Alphaproteobacteria bacterium]|nr:MAG: GntR family transcriptional regulator [Alphaproteobacteria bacterium]
MKSAGSDKPTEPLSPGRPRRLDRAPLLSLDLDGALGPDAGPPIHRRLYDGLRRAILSGRLAAGARLPSSRALAGELGLSRNTVLAALEQLASEGYVEGRSGSGTYVARALPDPAPDRPSGTPRPGRSAPESARSAGGAPGGPSARGRLLVARPWSARGASAGERRLFAVGLPEIDAFPFELWARLLGRRWRHPPAAMAVGGDPAGHPPLRAAIADHLRRVRAVDCTAEQVIVVSGIRQAVDLTVRLLLDPGDQVWVEEPGYPGIRAVLGAADLRILPLPVDEDGLDVAAGARAAPGARLACIAPSHQYPLGVVMSLKRRLDLLGWARDSGAWVIEDDYDSEFRYAGRPLAAMQGLDRDGRVIYVGSFSKSMFPSLRLGYLVAPPALIDAFLAARATLDDHAPMIAQPALADFLAEGHFAAHLRRMRRLYAARQQALLDAAARHLGGLLRLAPDQAGMHLVAELLPGLARRMDDRGAAAKAHAAGLAAIALSTFYMGPPRRQGLLLGYAAMREEEMDAAVRRLAAALAAPPA